MWRCFDLCSRFLVRLYKCCVVLNCDRFFLSFHFRRRKSDVKIVSVKGIKKRKEEEEEKDGPSCRPSWIRPPSLLHLLLLFLLRSGDNGDDSVVAAFTTVVPCGGGSRPYNNNNKRTSGARWNGTAAARHHRLVAFIHSVSISMLKERHTYNLELCCSSLCAFVWRSADASEGGRERLHR